MMESHKIKSANQTRHTGKLITSSQRGFLWEAVSWAQSGRLGLSLAVGTISQKPW